MTSDHLLRLQSQKDSLEKAYNTQSRKVDLIREAWVNETDVPRKLQHKQQLEDEKLILDELNSELIAIEQKLQPITEVIPDSTFIDELEKLFPQDDDLLLQCAKQVYQDFLLQLQAEPDTEDELSDLNEIWWQLRDWTEQIIMLEFVPRLFAYLIIKNNRYSKIFRDLERKFGIYQINSQELRTAVAKFKKEYQQLSGKGYLAIAINQKSASLELFQIDGWLTTENGRNFNSLKNRDLTGDERQEQGYTLENIQAVIRDFIIQISQRKQSINKLIIEIFLPASLFGWDVDQWELEPSNKIPLGIVYEVRIRSLDRLSMKYNTHKEKWHKKWASVKRCLNALPQFFLSNCNCNVKTLLGCLQNEQILGLKLKSAFKSGHEDIALALYYSGTPIAIWLRSAPPEFDCELSLNNLLQDCLLQLPERVFQQRCQSEQQLSLIWDDPNRIIPHHQLQ